MHLKPWRVPDIRGTYSKTTVRTLNTRLVTCAYSKATAHTLCGLFINSSYKCLHIDVFCLVGRPINFADQYSFLITIYTYFVHISCIFRAYYVWLKLVCVCTKAGVFKWPPFVNHVCTVYWIAGVSCAGVWLWVDGSVFTKGVSLFHSCMYPIGAGYSQCWLYTYWFGCTNWQLTHNVRCITHTYMIHMHGEFTYARGKRQLTHNVRCTHTNYDIHARGIYTRKG